MTYGTVFSGIGGWEIGLNACGWDLKWQCECDEFCRAVLRNRFGVPICEDVHGLPDWLGRQPSAGKVDAVIGSPPCQPFSFAGNQRGVSDERHLYPAFIRAVGQLRPRYVLMEQVPAVLSSDGGRAWGGYIGGLAALGYGFVWHCIPACALGAPHRRDRVWIVAHAAGDGCDQAGTGKPDASGEDMADPDKPGLEIWCKQPAWEEQSTAIRGCEALADTECQRCRQMEQPIPGRTESQGECDQAKHGSFAGRDGWWSTEPELGRVAHGVPNRAHRLRGLGNAIVPQIAFLIGRAINQVEAES